MARTKLPGVYMIRNKLNNKVYIGESVDIPTRFKRYRWAIKSNSGYAEVKRDIVQDIKKFGIENFEFKILVSGSKYKNRDTRLQVETEYIYEYQSYDSKYGYNETCGGEGGPSVPREQHILERNKRAKDMFLYNIKTGSVLLYFTGAKGIGKDLGFSKDVMSHSVNRGSLVLNRYFLIPANRKARKELLSKLEDKKSKASTPSAKAKATKSFEQYKDAVLFIDKVSKEFYGI